MLRLKLQRETELIAMNSLSLISFRQRSKRISFMLLFCTELGILTNMCICNCYRVQYLSRPYDEAVMRRYSSKPFPCFDYPRIAQDSWVNVV